MAIATECPYCKANYRLADNVEGKKVVCRHCNKAFLVRPAPGTGEKPESSERASAGPQVRARPAPGARRQPERRTQPDVDEDAAPVERSNRVLWTAAVAGGGFVLLLGAVIATWAIATRGSAPPPQAARN